MKIRSFLILGSSLMMSVLLGGFAANAFGTPEYASAISAGIFATSLIPMKLEAGTMFLGLTAKDILFTQGGINPGGVGQYIYYAFEEDILTWPAAITGADPLTAETFEELVEVPLADAFVFKAGKCFKKCYCTLEEGEVKAKVVGVRDSMSWENSCDISFPGNSSEAMGFLASAANRRMVALVPELNGKVRLVGHPLFPAQMSAAEYTSGKKVADGRKTTWTISSSSGTPAPNYLAPIQLTPAA